jgi:hypothetical protein
VVQEEIDLAAPSTLDVMRHILSDYFGRKPPLVTKPVTTAVTSVATPVTEVVTAQKPPLEATPDTALTAHKAPPVTQPVTKGSTVTTPEPTVTTPGSTPDKPKTLYGGTIYVIS